MLLHALYMRAIYSNMSRKKRFRSSTLVLQYRCARLQCMQHYNAEAMFSLAPNRLTSQLSNPDFPTFQHSPYKSQEYVHVPTQATAFTEAIPSRFQLCSTNIIAEKIYMICFHPLPAKQEICKFPTPL